jgi:hypothetical protein
MVSELFMVCVSMGAQAHMEKYGAQRIYSLFVNGYLNHFEAGMSIVKARKEENYVFLPPVTYYRFVHPLSTRDWAWRRSS